MLVFVSLVHGSATAAGAANDDDDNDAGSIAGHAAAVPVIDLPPCFALLASFPSLCFLSQHGQGCDFTIYYLLGH